MTAAEFTKDEEKRAKLAKILKDPILKEALEILESEVEPRTNFPVSLTSEIVAGHRYHQLAGAYHISRGLFRLTQPIKEPRTPQPKQMRKPPTE